MSSREFAEWTAWLSLEPRGDERLDWLFANLCRALSNVFARRPSRDVKRYILKFRRQGAFIDREALEQQMHAAARAHNQAIAERAARRAAREKAHSPVVEG